MKENVILMTMDAVRPDRLSCYGYDRIKTKGIDAIAEEGVLFKNCIAASCLTPVAHASILSGKNPDKTGVRDPFCIVKTTLVSDILKREGYKVPGDVSFVGMDDMELSSEIDPPLTTVSVKMEELGRKYVLKNHSWNIIVERYYKIYKELLK